jgi:uncharacterized repeat protein (TIGR01451 family)
MSQASILTSAPITNMLNIRPVILLIIVLVLTASLSQMFLPSDTVEARHSSAVGNDGKAMARRSASYGKLPMRLEANRGQTSGAVKFVARGSGYALFLSETGALLRVRRAESTKEEGPTSSFGDDTASLDSTIRFGLDGSNRSPKIGGLNELPGRSNYLVGSNARLWHTDVPAFEKVRYKSVYPGIDMIYYGREGRLEYDFVVSPGVSARSIRLRFDGASSTRIEENGDLLITTDGGDVRQQKPLAYQEVGDGRREVAVRYVKDARGRIRIKVGDYDRKLPLVIDPVLVYSSYIGGLGQDNGLAVAVDSTGSAYVVGSTFSNDFPTVNPFQSGRNVSNVSDAFVVKVNPDGKSLAYATYLGGSGSDVANAIAVDLAGNAYVSGLTVSSDFPTTMGAFQVTKNNQLDAFITKLNPSGASLAYSTYLGGDGSDQIFSIAVDSSGAAYVAGSTSSSTFTGFPNETRHGNPVQSSTDDGVTWAGSSTGIRDNVVDDFAALPVSSSVYAATNIGVYRSISNGALWELTGQSQFQTSTSPTGARAVVIDPSNPDVIYAGTSGGGVRKSTDDGVSYSIKNTGLTVPVVNTLAVNPMMTTTLYAGTIAGIFKTTDGGDNWVAQRNGAAATQPLTVNKLVIDPTNPQTVYAASSRGMLKTTDGGTNWVAINNGIFISGAPLQAVALAIDPAHTSTLYVGLSTPTLGVFKSTDGGASWTNTSSGLIDTSNGLNFPPLVRALFVDPSSTMTIFAGTSLGIFKSTDGGANWATSNAGLTSRNVIALSAHTGNPATLFVGAVAGNDTFVAKFDPAGANVKYLRVLGGSNDDKASGIAVGADGSTYVAGTTTSPDFPTANAFQSALKGGSDAFVMKLDPPGDNLTYSTFLGGSGIDQGTAIAVGQGGEAYVTGLTVSSDFPFKNASQPAPGDTSFFGDAFVTKLNADGGSLAYSTYLGGNSLDEGFGIAVGADGSAYVTGLTDSTDFPVLDAPSGARPTPFGNGDAFVSKLNPNGSAIQFSTYLGGSNSDQANGIAVDALGTAYVVGNTFSTDFPTVNPARASFGGGGDAFVTKIGPGIDLAVSMADSPDPVIFGNDLTYTINVKNNGDLQATGVTLTDALPAGANLVSATTNHGACSGTSTVVCSLGSMAGGEATTVTIVIKPPAVRTINNTATVALNETVAAPGNNSVSASTTVDFADLSVSKSALTGTVAPGSKVVYLLTVTNKNGITTGPVTLADNLPPEVTFSSCDSPHGTCGGTGNNRSVTFPSLSVGATENAVIVATVNSTVASGAVVNNTATVSSATADPDTSNNSASASFNAGSNAVGRKSNGKIIFVGSDGIYTINADGTGRTKIHSPLPDSIIERFPVLSPDGTKVVFEREQIVSSTFTFEYYVMDADGSNLHRVSTNGARDSRAAWSPDGSHVAFIGRDFGVYAVSSDGTGETRTMPSLGIASSLDWSPDGTRFVFQKDNTHIFVTDVDGSNQRQLTVTEHTPDGDTTDTDPFWSFDGSRISFTRRPANTGPDVFVINPDGTGLARLLNANASHGQLSPDGTKLLCFCSPDGMGVLNLDGTGLPVSLGSGNDPVWQALPNANPTPVQTPVQTFSISGRIANSDGSAGGALVKLSGTRTASRGTDANGNYTFVSLPQGGSYTVTPNTANFFTSITPGSRSVGDLESDTTSFDFVETIIQHTISGRVTDAQGQPMAGVTVSLLRFGARRDTTTDSDGRYSFPIIVGGDNYIVQPSFGLHSFDPINAALPTVSGNVTANFVGTPFSNARGIGGRIVDAAGNSIVGLPVTLSGARSAVMKTDANGNYGFVNLPTGQNYTVTPSTAEGFTFTQPQQTFNNFSFDQGASFTATTTQPVAQFSATEVSVAENTRSVMLTVTRTGDTSAAASVDYETADVTASQRSDYIAAFGTIRFAKGDTSQTFKVLVTDNNRLDGERLFSVTLKSGSGVRVGATNTATVHITDDDTTASSNNPVDSSQFFVSQHYADFLNREPDASGLQFWTNEIESCGADAACREVKRVNVSAAFFLSIEFQQTGYLVYRLNHAAFGTGQALKLKTFLKDTQEIGRGVIVGQGDWQGQLEANKQSFINAFVLRPEFMIAYPTTLPSAQFVDALNANTGGSLSQTERDSLVAALSTGAATRAGVLRSVAENNEFSRRELNKAFVLMQYFGYLRRNPDDPPDSDFSGWQFWLNKLNQFNGDFIGAEMVKAFISSNEYRHRFGQ